MRHILILIILSILLLTSPLFGQPKETGVLYIWENGTKYLGEWKDGKKHGQGTFTYGKGKWEGDKYDGEWKDGERWKGTSYDQIEDIKSKYVNGKRTYQ